MAPEDFMKEKKLLSLTRQCIENYGLIRENDVIGVGVSGGKDSLVLLYALKKLSEFHPAHFSVKAFTVDAGFEGMDFSKIGKFCDDLKVPWFLEKTEIAGIIAARSEPHPCSLCSNMRRGTLANALERENCTVLALGHHKDDYLTTLMMSALFKGQLYSFAPFTVYEDRNLRIIRPMLYLSESAVASFAEEQDFPVVRNSCPWDKNTEREEMKQLLSEIALKYPGSKDRLLHALETSDIPDWTAARRERN